MTREAAHHTELHDFLELLFTLLTNVEPLVIELVVAPGRVISTSSAARAPRAVHGGRGSVGMDAQAFVRLELGYGGGRVGRLVVGLEYVTSGVQRAECDVERFSSLQRYTYHQESSIS